MHIEILNIILYVGYLIIGIIIAFWTKLTKLNSDKIKEKEVM